MYKQLYLRLLFSTSLRNFNACKASSRVGENCAAAGTITAGSCGWTGGGMLRAGAAIVKSGLGNGVSVDMTEMILVELEGG